MTEKKRKVKRDADNTKKLTVPQAIRDRLLRSRGASLALSKSAGVSRGFVSDVLHDRKAPSKKLFDAIVGYLDLDGRRMTNEAHRMAMGSNHHEKL